MTTQQFEYNDGGPMYEWTADNVYPPNAQEFFDDISNPLNEEVGTSINPVDLMTLYD